MNEMKLSRISLCGASLGFPVCDKFQFFRTSSSLTQEKNKCRDYHNAKCLAASTRHFSFNVFTLFTSPAIAIFHGFSLSKQNFGRVNLNSQGTCRGFSNRDKTYSETSNARLCTENIFGEEVYIYTSFTLNEENNLASERRVDFEENSKHLRLHSASIQKSFCAFHISCFHWEILQRWNVILTVDLSGLNSQTFIYSIAVLLISVHQKLNFNCQLH